MLHGRLTADPEVKPAKNGRTVTTFSVATNRNWKNKQGELVSETNFHRVVAFGKLAEITGEYLRKGRPVLVSGRLNNSSYVSKEGTKKYKTEVVLEDFNFLSGGAKAKAEKVAA